MRATFESGITDPPLVSGGLRCGGKAPKRTAVLVAHPGHGRPGGRNASPAGGYDGHRPCLSSDTGRQVRVIQTGARTQYQTRAAPRQELGRPPEAERRLLGLCRLAEVGEYTGADDLRVGVEAAEQFDGHVAFRVEQTEQYVLHTDVLVAEGESLALRTFERTFRPRHEREMPGHIRLFASAPPPRSPAPRLLARNVLAEPGIVECTWPEAGLHPPAHLIKVDPQRAQRLGVTLTQATPAHQLAQRRAAGIHGDAKIGRAS